MLYIDDLIKSEQNIIKVINVNKSKQIKYPTVSYLLILFFVFLKVWIQLENI